MKSLISKVGLYLLAGLLLTSCDKNDELSQIGGTIQSPRDRVESQLHRLQFEAKSVRAERVYSANSTTSLLGEISDPVYGDFHGEFVARLRTARGFAFDPQPLDGKIDSVKLLLSYSKAIGEPNSEMKLSVYETRGLVGQTHSIDPELLEPYRRSEHLLGERHLNIRDNSFWRVFSARDSILTLALPLKTEVGQRIYNLSVSRPQAFDSQAAFDQEVLGALLVSPTTGRGNVLQVTGTTLVIYYTYKDKEGKSKVANVEFISTKLTGHVNALSNPHSEQLLEPSTDYFYIKQPAGVVGEIRLGREQLQRLLEGKPQVSIGKNWSLADAQLKIDVNNPSNLLLNPPSYMMLMPQDSVASFFSQGQTERSRAATSYLSTRYTVEHRYYNFANISRLITEHLRQHARYESGGWHIGADLSLRLIPVARVAQQSGETVQIEEELFPSFVRLDKQAEKLRIEVVSSQFRQ